MSNITREEIEHYRQAAKMIQTCDVDKGKHITVTPEHMIEIARIALETLDGVSLTEVYRSAYEEARQDGSVNWEAATSLAEENEELKCKPEAAEKCIAELEARTVNLPKRSVGEVMHMSGFSRDYAEGWCAGNDNAIHEIRAAGIGIKES